VLEKARYFVLRGERVRALRFIKKVLS